MDYGIDISHYNTVNDWAAVAGNNITFASIKVTESVDFTDGVAGAHTAGARSAGIHPGGYHFARDVAIDGQVIHFVNTLQAHALLNNDAMAPMLDMEAAELRDNADAFVTEFIRQYRFVTGLSRIFVYANLDWWTNVLSPNVWADDEVRLWIARYNGDPGNPGWYHPRLALHQHTNQGVVPGIPGYVDRNATHGAFALEHLIIA